MVIMDTGRQRNIRTLAKLKDLWERNIVDNKPYIKNDIGLLWNDFEKIDKIAQSGTYGVKGRLTFGGQNKLGVVIQLGIDEDLEMIVQDDLTGLVDFRVVAEGHVAS